jgi:hypothetical protein
VTGPSGARGENMKGTQRKTLIIAVVLLSIILAAYFVAEKNRDNKAVSEKKERILSLIPDISGQDLDRYMAQDVFAVYGKTGASNPDPAKILDSSRDKLTPYLYPDGPVCGYSVSYLGFIEIYLYDGTPIDRTTTDNIYRIIDASSKNFPEENIPVMFIRTQLPISDRNTVP